MPTPFQASRLTGLTYRRPDASILGDLHYGYDPVGQPTTVSGSLARSDLPQAVTTASYNAANQLLDWDGTAYQYDANGNLIDDGVSTYTWNARNQLLDSFHTEGQGKNKVTIGGSYTYDPFGRRAAKTVDGVVTSYQWSGSRMVAERDAAGQRTHGYLYDVGSFSPLQVEDANGVYQAITDHLGTPQQLTNDAGEVVWDASYEPYGKALASNDPDGDGVSIEQNMRFPGQHLDQETGLHYNYFRYYDPETGRYITSDPIGLAGGLNTYAYVSGNPISFFDPFGLAQAGDVAFFSWSGTTWPNHATVVTRVDANGNATHAFGAWDDTMTFHEVDLSRYNGGIQDNIIGYGDMSGLNSGSFQDFLSNWNGRPVAPNWDGSQGQVCIDATTAVDGWGGNTLRDAMRQDYQNNPGSYRDFGAGPANPNNSLFYRRNGWLQQFFQNTNRYQIP